MHGARPPPHLPDDGVELWEKTRKLRDDRREHLHEMGLIVVDTVGCKLLDDKATPLLDVWIHGRDEFNLALRISTIRCLKLLPPLLNSVGEDLHPLVRSHLEGMS